MLGFSSLASTRLRGSVLNAVSSRWETLRCRGRCDAAGAARCSATSTAGRTRGRAARSTWSRPRTVRLFVACPAPPFGSVHSVAFFLFFCWFSPCFCREPVFFRFLSPSFFLDRQRPFRREWSRCACLPCLALKVARQSRGAFVGPDIADRGKVPNVYIHKSWCSMRWLLLRTGIY